VEKEFSVEVNEVLVRPMGHALSIQVHIFLDRSMTLDKVNDIVNKMQNTVGKKFEAEETLIIPEPR
jgi:divalent metal cation (Fe/Co/Zn/Cd) transporter